MWQRIPRRVEQSNKQDRVYSLSKGGEGPTLREVSAVSLCWAGSGRVFVCLLVWVLLLLLKGCEGVAVKPPVGVGKGQFLAR